MNLKSGYYISELDQIIRAIVGDEILKKFYEENLFYEVSNVYDFIDTEIHSPIIKVAWNILSRGEPTIASLLVSDVILRENLLDDYYGVSKDNPEIEITFSKDLFQSIDGSILIDIFNNFSNNRVGYIASSYGSAALKLFCIYNDLIAVSQIERTIILLLLSGIERQVLRFNILGVRDSLAIAIIEDLNQLFSSLNNLIASEEGKIPTLEYGNGENTVCISYGQKISGVYSILRLNSLPDSFFRDILTDRKIIYKQLGTVFETEVENRYKQRFEFDTSHQENALIYFLQNIFRKSRFKPGQIPIINRAIQNKDVIGLLPTGGGKSLTYQLCALLQPGVTIVVDPINSLMKDQFDKLLDYGITKANYINSFNSKDEREQNLQELSDSKYLIIFVSPERFQIDKFRNSLASCSNNGVYYSYAVIDECHCVSEWGHDFRHTYLKLAQNLKRFCICKDKPLVLFGLTATASYDVLADVQRELEIPENAIISLPAESIDRKELNFEIIKIDNEIGATEFWERENLIGELKYPKIVNFLNQIPGKIRALERQYGYLNPGNNFYEKHNNQYSNSGVIFCPTKSNRLRNGVIVLSDYLKKMPFLELTTFFGAGDDDTIKDERIESEALLSIKNQAAFIGNEKNLMIATKAFGMGIDKPNIRFSLHYSFPVSVESFYQEAGRAGRDSKPSICSILYHPEDIKTNFDFYRNAFKGESREREIIDELLDEVQYEDNFYLNVLKRQVQDKYHVVQSIRIWKDRYLYINGRWNPDAALRINIGNIDLERNLKYYDDSIKNIDISTAQEILGYTKELLHESCPDGKYLEYLNTKSSDGIKTLIESKTKNFYTLKIGFTNDIVSQITKYIIGLGYEDFDDIIVRAAYNFCSDENDFIGNLKYQFGKYTHFQSQLRLHDEAVNFIKGHYNKIRNSSDTQRAIYRMSIVGIIDDYVIDYVGRYIEVKFKPKTNEEYISYFRIYLKRYLGNQSTERWIKKVQREKGNSILKKVLYVLIKFIESEISAKRKRSIEYMKQLCEVGSQEGDKMFRENIVYYFTSNLINS